MKHSRFFLTLAFAYLALTFSLAARVQAQTFDYFAFFNGTDGDGPNTIIQGTDGNFYTTTSQGGPLQYGNIVRITPSGEITSLYDFCSKPQCSDGAIPFSPPILGSDGNLYGVTYAGGSDLDNGNGWGTVYKMALDGQFTTLHTFCTYPCDDGVNPKGIVQAADGNLYGVTSGGGEFGGGTIYRITTTGEFKVVHNFCSLADCADGQAPESSPILGSDGNLYGTTYFGNGEDNSGTVYSLTPSGTFGVVHTFSFHNTFDHSYNEGEDPIAVVQDAHGNLFGTTYEGGTFGQGNIFEITSTHQYRVLHNFTYGPESSVYGVTYANDGNLYGTAGGINAQGSMFEITPAGDYTTIQYFFGKNGIWGPYGFYQAPNGNLYGSVATYNHNNDNGALFGFSNDFSPSVQTVPGGGKVGASVLILGDNLTGSTSVTFNGVAAAFTVESDTYIKATVPAGATTGVVSVVTPSGTLNSNPQFVVSK
jgi:uncharacterized repeat protein (TIGR03803 family)